MTGKGYIKLHREIIDHPVFKNALAFRLFIAILVLADRKTGTLATSYAQLGKVVGVYRQHMSALIKHLVDCGSITVDIDKNKKRSSPTFISIIHFYKWQLGVTPEVTGCNSTGYTGVTPEVTGCNSTGNTPLPFKQEVKQEDKQEGSSSPVIAREDHDYKEEPMYGIGGVTRLYPVTPDEVIQQATLRSMQMTEEQAKAFIEAFRACGWRDRFNRPIQDWTYFVKPWIENWTEREARKKLYGPGNPNASKAGYGVDMDEDERARRRDFQ